MRLPSWLRTLESGLNAFSSYPGGPANLLTSTPAKSRRLLYTAAFFTFASLGFIVDVLRPEIQSWPLVVLSAALTGLTAVAFVYVVTYYPRWFPVAIVVMLATTFGGSILLNRTASTPMAEATDLAIRVKFTVDGLGCLLCFVLSYTFFMGFIAAEGTRHTRVMAEIELAREIHRLLVPTIDQRSGRFEFFGLSVPSTEVGGDLVDVVPTTTGWVGYVADVSGHGVGAGLLMGILKSALRTRILASGGLAAVLTDINQVLVPLRKPNMFVTLAAVSDDGAGGLAFSVAGHPPILHYRADSGTIEELTVPQVPLGMFEERTFTSARVAPEPGDLIAIVTDGLTEVFDAADQEFGMARLTEAIRANATRPLGEIGRILMQQARAHGPQSDDQTLLLIRTQRQPVATA